MVRLPLLVLALLTLGGCTAGCGIAPFGPAEDDSPLDVAATDGTADTAPLFSWTPVGATSAWVTDPNDRVVWGIEAGSRPLADNRSERVLIESPVPYGAYAEGGGAVTEPRTTTAPAPLEPGTTYTVHVTYLGGGSGGFTGRRPVVRRGSATFRVAVRVDP